MSEIPEEATERESVYRTPRWVKVSGIIVIALILLVVIVLVTGVGGEHGPGRHAPSGDAGGDTPSSTITEAHTPPIEHGEQQP